MSKLNKFTIGTKLTEKEVIKILKHNTESFESFDSYDYWRIYAPLPFYGDVYDDGTFKFKLPMRRRGIPMGLKAKPLIALKGRLENNNNYTRVKVKVCELFKHLKFNLIIYAFLLIVCLYANINSNFLPEFLPYAIGTIVIIQFCITAGVLLFYIHRTKKMLKEILYAD